MEGGVGSGSISIRKKSRHSIPEDTKQIGRTDALQDISGAATGIGRHTDVLTQRAMDDLKLFLQKKGVASSKADEFKIHIKQKSHGNGSYSIHYTDKNGEMYLSKGDLLVSLDRPSVKVSSSQVC